jgi:hypothetical protein
MTPTEALFASLRTFLAERVQPQLDPYTAFESRIAMNLLGMLEREAQLGPKLEALDSALARAHNMASDAVGADLARALRDGALAPDANLMRELRRRTLLQLAIDNPRYSGFEQACSRWPELSPRQVDDGGESAAQA